MITIAALTFDALAYMQITPLPNSDVSSIERRVNRVATLDGGISINDFGLSDGDRTFEIRWRPRSTADVRLAEYVVRTHSRVRVSTAEGVFLAAIQSYKQESNESRMTLLILKRDSE